MNRKTKVFKIACYLNLSCILIVVGTFLYQTNDQRFTSQDFLDLSWIFIAILIYTFNFYYGTKMIYIIAKALNVSTINQKIRKAFFILEIIATLFYSFLVYYAVLKFRIDRFIPVTIYNISDLLVIICLFTGYISSVTRIFLTKAIVQQIDLQLSSFVDDIGTHTT